LDELTPRPWWDAFTRAGTRARNEKCSWCLRATCPAQESARTRPARAETDPQDRCPSNEAVVGRHCRRGLFAIAPCGHSRPVCEAACRVVLGPLQGFRATSRNPPLLTLKGLIMTAYAACHPTLLKVIMMPAAARMIIDCDAQDCGTHGYGAPATHAPAACRSIHVESFTRNIKAFGSHPHPCGCVS
jgi:hypothetical protein